MFRTFTAHNVLGDQLRFRSLKGTEGVSELSSFSVTVISERPDVSAKALLGTDMSIEIDLLTRANGEGTRYLSGQVTEFIFKGRDGDYYAYEVTLRPWLWLATKRSDFKIFQNKTVPEIVQEVLSPYGFMIENRLIHRYRTWEYCVQYGESDYNFISRLLQHEGAYYFFSHKLGSHSLILADDIGSHSFLLNGPTVIPYYPSNRVAVVHDEDSIDKWASYQIIVSGGYETRDYDPEKSRVLLRSYEYQPAGHSHDSKDVYQWPGGFFNVYQGDTYAKINMDQITATSQAVSGGGSLRNIAPGYFFELDKYPVDTYNQQYLIEWAKYEFTENIERSDGGGIDTPTTYHIHFTAVPSNVRYRALRPIHKPLTHGPQTAVVTGPPGEEIWTDKYGRVKVQFHWDRYGTNDENSSCWIRVSQVWAGTNYGVIHTPRVGQEVIVDFLNGDPDYPIITGRVYNDMQMPPWELPKYKTESGIQTLSSKGGGGKHMLRFEDQKGIEHINLGTDYGETHLLMGYLLNQVNNVQRSYGFELRTNDWGAIRAKKGLLLTTYDQNRREHITHNNPEGYTQLGANLEAAQALMEQAKEAVTSMAAAISNLTELKNSNMIQMSADIESMVGMAAATTSLNQVAAAIKDFAASGNETGAQPEQQMPTNTDPAMKQAVDMHAKSKDINQPIVSIVSPEGQSIISPKPVVVSSGQSVSMHGTGAVTVSTQDQLTQLVKNGMLTHISSGGQRTTVTSGDVAHEAQSGHMNLVAQQNITMGSTDADASLLAKQNINVSATEDSVLIKAGKHIRLEAGSSITLVVGDKAFVQLTNDGNIIVCGKAKGVLQFDDELDQFGKSINLNCDETT